MGAVAYSCSKASPKAGINPESVVLAGVAVASDCLRPPGDPLLLESLRQELMRRVSDKTAYASSLPSPIHSQLALRLALHLVGPMALHLDRRLVSC